MRPRGYFWVVLGGLGCLPGPPWMSQGTFRRTPEASKLTPSAPETSREPPGAKKDPQRRPKRPQIGPKTTKMSLFICVFYYLYCVKVVYFFKFLYFMYLVLLCFAKFVFFCLVCWFLFFLLCVVVFIIVFFTHAHNATKREGEYSSLVFPLLHGRTAQPGAHRLPPPPLGTQRHPKSCKIS